jgi:DNA-binding FadR family transcriptional regulator
MLAAPVVPEPRATRVDQVVAEVAHRIGDGRLAVGERLPAERSLCATFGVGRTTLREALRLLLAQGYVVRQRRGLAVAGLPAVAARASIRDLYEVRKLLEVRIARWAAMRTTEADLVELRATVLGTGAFHDALARAAHNPVLLKLYEPSRPLFFHLPFYWPLLDEAEVETARARRHELARQWHCAVLEAIERRDSDEAEGAMFQHLDSMEKDLLRRLPARAEPRRDSLSGKRPGGRARVSDAPVSGATLARREALP